MLYYLEVKRYFKDDDTILDKYPILAIPAAAIVLALIAWFIDWMFH